MEPLTIRAIASALLLKVFDKGGEKLGETVANKIGSLLNVIREKFKAKGVEEKLTKAQQDPSEENKSQLEQELAVQMEDDAAFAKKLEDLVEELKSDPNPSIQIFFKDVEVGGEAEIGDINQTNKLKESGRQEAVTKVKIGGSFKIGDVEQRQ